MTRLAREPLEGHIGIGRQILGDPVREILLLPIVAEVREGQDNDRHRRGVATGGEPGVAEDTLAADEPAIGPGRHP